MCVGGGGGEVFTVILNDALDADNNEHVDVVDAVPTTALMLTMTMNDLE